MSPKNDWSPKQAPENPEVTVNYAPNMLQKSSQQFMPTQAPQMYSQYDAESPEILTSEEDPFFKLMEYWHVLYRRKFTFLALAFIGAIAGLAYCVLQVPLYQSRTSMEMQGSVNALSSISLTGTGDVSIQTQIDILKSRSMLDRVSAKIVPADDLELQEQPDLLASWRKALGVQSEWGPESWQEAVWKARETLQITSSRDSQIIKLQCESTHPQVAAGFLNGLTNEYIEQRMNERWETYQSTSKWLAQAQEELKAKLEASEQELAQYARSSGLLFTSESDSVAEEKLKQLQSALSGAQAQRIAKQAQYEASKSSKPEALPEVLDSGPIGTYQVQLTELRRQMAELSSTLTPEHYRIKRLQSQIDEIESAITRERSNILKRIRNEYEAALETENKIRAEYDLQVTLISGQAEGLIKYRILKREAETNRQLYELTLQKGKEASIESALRASDARVIDHANPPGFPYKPVLPLNIALGLTGGLLLGSAFVILRERWHESIHLPGMMPLPTNIRELGVIPSAKLDRLIYPSVKHSIAAASKHRSLLAGKSLLGLRPNESGNGHSHHRLELVTSNQKPSTMAEAFRQTVASILFSTNGQSGMPRAIVVSSPSPREGKTTVVCNLSVALAEVNRTVLLVDGDMRIPRIHDVFALSNSWGLGDLLREKRPISEYPIEELVHATEIPNLSVLSSGSIRTGSSSLLYSPRLAEFLARCRSEFSVVLIDAPPVLNVPDARIFGHAADYAVLVLRASSTTRDEAAAALRCFEEDGTVILGTILNDWNPNNSAYGKYGYYSHYSSYHYGS